MKHQKKHFLFIIAAIFLSIIFHLCIMIEGPSYWLLNPIHAVKKLPKKIQELVDKKKEKSILPKKSTFATKISTITQKELKKESIQEFKILHRSQESIKTEKKESTVQEHLLKDGIKDINQNQTKENIPNQSTEAIIKDANQIFEENDGKKTNSQEHASDKEIISNCCPEESSKPIVNAIGPKKKNRRKKFKNAQYSTNNTFQGLFDQKKFESTITNLQNDGVLDLSNQNFYGDHRFTTYTNRIGLAIRSSLASLSIKKRYYQSIIDKFQKEQRKVFLEFIVANNGTITVVDIIKSSGLAEADKYFEEAIYDISSSIPSFPRWIPYKYIKLKLGFTADPSDHGSEVISFNDVQTW